MSACAIPCRAACTATSSQPGITLIFTRRYPCSSAVDTRWLSVPGVRSSGIPRATPHATLPGLDLEAHCEELWEPDAATVRVEIPGGGLDPGAREGIAADGVAQGGVHGLGGVELPPQDPRDQDALNQVAGARQRLLGVERQLERRRLA